MACHAIADITFNWSRLTWPTNAAVHALHDEAALVPKNPMVGSLPGRCARAARGHVAAPPMSVMKPVCTAKIG
jgi:hypothetical protein